MSNQPQTIVAIFPKTNRHYTCEFRIAVNEFRGDRPALHLFAREFRSPVKALKFLNNVLKNEDTAISRHSGQNYLELTHWAQVWEDEKANR